ncbi:MAG: hypothetical protein V3S98_06200 [Dehalococcoidia bacterium]
MLEVEIDQRRYWKNEADRLKIKVDVKESSCRQLTIMFDAEETKAIKLEVQLNDLLIKLRQMRDGVERFRETMMQVDTPMNLNPGEPETAAERIRDTLGLPRDGSAVQWGKQSPTAYNIENPRTRS